jgi:hypothetical protein
VNGGRDIVQASLAASGSAVHRICRPRYPSGPAGTRKNRASSEIDDAITGSVQAGRSATIEAQRGTLANLVLYAAAACPLISVEMDKQPLPEGVSSAGNQNPGRLCQKIKWCNHVLCLLRSTHLQHSAHRQIFLLFQGRSAQEFSGPTEKSNASRPCI